MHRMELIAPRLGGQAMHNDLTRISENLAEAIAFAAEGKVRTEIHRTRLDNINQVFSDLKAGKIDGRAVLMM